MVAVAVICLAALLSGERLVRRRILRRWGCAAGRMRVGPAERRRGRSVRDLDEMSAADLSILVTEVSARLKAGAPVEAAWRSAWSRVCAAKFAGLGEDGAPIGVVELARASGWRAARGGRRGVGAAVRARSPRVRAVRRAAEDLVAACRLSATIGAPLASILDVVAEGLEEAEAQEEARRVAAQGARTSARVLRALPLLGIAVAQVMGAHPLERFVDGGFGTMMAVTGACLLIASRIVSESLIARAASPPGALDEAIGVRSCPGRPGIGGVDPRCPHRIGRGDGGWGIGGGGTGPAPRRVLGARLGVEGMGAARLRPRVRVGGGDRARCPAQAPRRAAPRAKGRRRARSCGGARSAARDPARSAPPARLPRSRGGSRPRSSRRVGLRGNRVSPRWGPTGARGGWAGRVRGGRSARPRPS